MIFFITIEIAAYLKLLLYKKINPQKSFIEVLNTFNFNLIFIIYDFAIRALTAVNLSFQQMIFFITI